MSTEVDRQWMQQALQLARAAAQRDEVPVGALLVLDGQRIADGANVNRKSTDPTAHAEIVALRRAADILKTDRLDNSTLYVTLEPCLMCCGALLQARVSRLVYGAREPRTGAVVSAFETLMPAHRMHHIAVTEGVLADECGELMRRFFEARRTRSS